MIDNQRNAKSGVRTDPLLTPRPSPLSPGFTLVEILIAMAVFLIGVVAIIGVFPEGLKTTSKSVDDTVAGYVVQSIRDALVDSIRRNVNDVEEPAGDTDQAYWVRWFHDGLPATGATYRLPRTFPCDAEDPTQWGDAVGTRYNLPDYFKGASVALHTGAWDYIGQDNPNKGAKSMLSARSAGPETRVTLNRGWWWPDMSTTPVADWDTTSSLMTELVSNGGAGAVPTKSNQGVEVVRLGTLSGTTASARNERNVEFPDPLSTYSFQFIAQIFNDLTPGGDTIDGDPTSYIPCTPFPTDSECEMIPNPFYPDNPAGSVASAKYRDRVRKDMRPGLMAVTFFPFKSWRLGMTGTNGAADHIDRDEAREQNCVRLFQFLVSFTQ